MSALSVGGFAAASGEASGVVLVNVLGVSIWKQLTKQIKVSLKLNFAKIVDMSD